MAIPRLWHPVLAAVGLALLAVPSASKAPRHAPITFTQRLTDADLDLAGQQGLSIEHSPDARYRLAEHRRLEAALTAVRSQRKGVVEAFVLTVALDSDEVFAREAREADRVLTRRYNAGGHSIVLAGLGSPGDTVLPMGSVANIEAALARLAEVMGPEDVLVLYTTSHGAPFGIVYNSGDTGFGVIGPMRLAAMLNELGIRRRLVLISACYSGVFVGPVITPDTAILTAASSQRSSFGCQADNDWTFFGDALINHALRKPQPFAAAAQEARSVIAGWEGAAKLTPSQPQLYIGGAAAVWLATLEHDLPAPSVPVGRPATDALKADGR